MYGDMKKNVHCLAVSAGRGKVGDNAGDKKGADVLVTGDIGHHDGIDAVEQGLAVIDAGHYGTEYIFHRRYEMRFYMKNFRYWM